jgi:hypothetical protein
MMEARNIRLSHDNTKLNEVVRRQEEQVLNESHAEKKERVQKAKNVSGKGHRKLEETVVITEHNDATPGSKEQDSTLLESLGLDRSTAALLAGTKKQS